MRISNALAALVALTLCCTHHDPIEETVKQLQSSVEKRDSDKTAALLAPDFIAGDQKKEDVVTTLRGYFFAYSSLDVTISELKVAKSDATASADFLADVAGSPRQGGGLDQILPRRTRLHLHITLRREGSSWLIDSASWDRVE